MYGQQPMGMMAYPGMPQMFPPMGGFPQFNPMMMPSTI